MLWAACAHATSCIITLRKQYLVEPTVLLMLFLALACIQPIRTVAATAFTMTTSVRWWYKQCDWSMRTVYLGQWRR